MHLNKLFSILTCLLWPAAAIHSLCLTSPVVSLEAGQSVLSAHINAPQSTRCQATMSFGDSSFLPLRFNFSTTPCEGQLIAKFTTPAEVPNGEADIFWQCAGLAPYCYQANITNGTSDPTMQLDREAQVGCINEVLRTTSVLVVKTMSTRTTTETAVSVFTWTTTSFPRSQETSPTVTLPSQSWVTSGVATPSSTVMNKDPTGTDTTAARAPTADSVRVEIPRSDIIGRTVRTTSPLPVTTDTVFDSGASKVTTPLVTSAVTTFLTTTLLRTVTVSCAAGSATGKA